MAKAKSCANVKYGEFHDDDLEGMLTAIAFWPMEKTTGDKHFGHLRLA
jgi:hypothetical protein